jgi:hypothetical protein
MVEGVQNHFKKDARICGCPAFFLAINKLRRTIKYVCIKQHYSGYGTQIILAKCFLTDAQPELATYSLIFHGQQRVRVRWGFAGVFMFEVRIHIDTLTQPSFEALLPRR